MKREELADPWSLVIAAREGAPPLPAELNTRALVLVAAQQRHPDVVALLLGRS